MIVIILVLQLKVAHLKLELGNMSIVAAIMKKLSQSAFLSMLWAKLSDLGNTERLRFITECSFIAFSVVTF